MSWFEGLTLAGWLTVVGTAYLVRSRPFATFVAVLVGVYSLSAVGISLAFSSIMPVFAAFHVAVYVNFLGLSRPRMRPFVYRLFVSWPAAFFVGGTLLGLPWALLVAAGLHPWAPWLPYALAAIGVVQSLATRREVLDLVIAGDGGEHAPKLARHPRGSSREERPLCIVQISDPHLGPFMSVARLRRIAERAVAAKPDLVVLTGDFLTMESQTNPDDLRVALEPLSAMPGRVFACHGNHDHEAPELVARALRTNGIALLVDASSEIETEAGPVQIVGMDYAWRDRQGHLQRVCAAHPRRPGATRIVLLHDPSAFKHLPEGEGDLVLCGHTHGGQVGLVSLGLSWTFLRIFGDAIPDHGFWARGRDRMYIHRGTGHYGFPLRLGVPAEESVLRVHRAPG
jgi:predicted MPP superfamily phosphohydrolase